MGIDLYLIAEEHQDEISACSRELANEVDVVAGLGDGTLIDFVCGEEESVYHDPAQVLAAVEKSIKRARKLKPGAFLGSKELCVSELEELVAPLQKAVENNVKVCVTFC